MPWARIGVAVVVLAVAAAIAIGLANRSTPAPIAAIIPPADRVAAPDLTLPVLQAADGVGPVGAEARLKDLRGRVVVVNLWASWCGPCRDEIPTLTEAAQRQDPARAVVLGINAEDTEADATNFLTEMPFPYASLRDPSPATAMAFRVRGYPSTLILDRQGRIAARYPGAIEDADQIDQPVELLLGEG